MFGKKSYLEKCKKIFDKHNLILYKGLYPICREDNNDRVQKGGGFVTRHQLKVGDILLNKKYEFIIEYKIEAKCFGNFYCDFLVQGKYHKFCLEIDGNHHYTNQKQILRDLKKEKFLVEHHNILTIRIPNKMVEEYEYKPKNLENELKILDDKLYIKKNEYSFIKKKLGELKCEVCRAKKRT